VSLILDEIKELIKKAQSGDINAKEKIIQDNIGLIWSVVRRFLNRGYEADDLFQIGAIGLLKCIEKFDMSFDVKFSTYAVPMIMGEIKKFLRDDGLIKISRPLKEIAVKIKIANDNYLKLTGNSPTIEYLEKELNISQEELLMAIESSKNIESLYQTVNQPDGNVAYLIDKIAQDKISDFDFKIIENLAVKNIIDKLETDEKKIIVLRYFKGKTQSEIAKELNISQVQVSRLEKKILIKMREYF
jgi:RNA polymerase sporulation-specific sigma factor